MGELDVAVSGVPDVNAVARDFFSPTGKNQHGRIGLQGITDIYIPTYLRKWFISFRQHESAIYDLGQASATQKGKLLHKD